MTSITPAEMATAFRRAVEVLDERGWGQGRYVAPDGCVCVGGALNMAAGMPVDHSIMGAWPDMAGPVLPLREALEAYLEEHPAVWNDHPLRTEAEVKATLLAVADRCEKVGASA